MKRPERDVAKPAGRKEKREQPVAPNGEGEQPTGRDGEEQAERDGEHV
mgnify:CR=1 FL=1